MSVTYAVGNIMTENIICMDAAVRMADAMKLMVSKEIGSVVVTRDDDMVGIVTERDVLKRLCDDPQGAAEPVGSVMSSPLITIDWNAAIGLAADKMAEKRIRRLLVTEDGKIRGIITERDLMRATIDVFKKLSDAWI
jgi:CBS domain-containing protein